MKVASDKGGDWHFVGNDTYHCLDKKGKIIGRLLGKYLPDPNQLWLQRCIEKGVVANSPEGKVLKPNKVVFDLWEFANAKHNN